MRLELISFSAQGEATARRLSSGLHGEEMEPEWRQARVRCTRSSELPCPLSDFVKTVFGEADGIVFVGAAGIAVRLIAPYVKDKRTDPAVVVVDELGRFSISLLSGHLGGANALASAAAGVLGAQPVITTATDLHGAFAVDVFAKTNQLVIGSMSMAKEISAAVLSGEKAGFFSDVLVEGTVPEELTPDIVQKQNIRISKQEEIVPEGTLCLYPKTAVLGMGCRKGASAEELRKAAEEALGAAGVTGKELLAVASIDLKKEESGLLKLAAQLGAPLECFSSRELSEVSDSGFGFSESEFVRKTTGVGNVCERAAVKSAQEWMKRLGFCGRAGQPALQVRKLSLGRATAAVVRIPPIERIRFDYREEGSRRPERPGNQTEG